MLRFNLTAHVWRGIFLLILTTIVFYVNGELNLRKRTVKRTGVNYNTLQVALYASHNFLILGLSFHDFLDFYR